MESQQESYRITLITLASAVIGFLSLSANPLFCSLYLSIIILPKYKQISPHHTWKKLASFTFTTFVFGLINGYTYNNVLSCINQQQNSQIPVFSIYLSLLTIYHYFQFQLINNFHHQTLSWQSFLIYHSKNYTMATSFSLAQHLITRYLFHFQYKNNHLLMFPALLIAILGQSLRIAAFFTCKSNFTHVVRLRKEKNHILITTGVYSIFRHPSYTGYFYFSVFSQAYLGNFVSMTLFAIALRKFFDERIQFEEEALIKFFPQYLDYRKKTHIFIPFVGNHNFQAECSHQQVKNSDFEN